MKKSFISILALFSVLGLSGCGSSGSWSRMTTTFIGALRTEAQALGVFIEQEFIKAANEGIVVAIREKESKNVICQTIISNPAEAGRITQFIPFARNKDIAYQVQILMGAVATPWVDF